MKRILSIALLSGITLGGVPMIVGGLNALNPAARFDLIVLHHVLEHLPDPMQTLRDCARHLAPQGRLVLEVPNLGGWQFPYIESFGLPAGLVAAIQVMSFLAKIAFLLFFFIWVRWSIPRFRYDQLMSLGWKVMFPLSLINIIWVACLIMIFKL